MKNIVVTAILAAFWNTWFFLAYLSELLPLLLPLYFQPFFDISVLVGWQRAGGLSEIQLFQYFTTFFPEMHNDIDF